MNWHHTWTMRAAARRDAQPVADMVNARLNASHGAARISAEHVNGWWSGPNFTLTKDVRVVVDATGCIVGMAHIWSPTTPYVNVDCSALAHPFVGECETLWDRLYGWATARAREYVPLAPDGARVVACEGIGEKETARRAAIERAGYEMVRVTNRMWIDLSKTLQGAEWPERVSVRTACIERDLRGIVEADVESIRDHWGYVEKPFEAELARWKEYIASEGTWFDPSLWLLAVDGDEIAGFSLCSAHVGDDSTRGYIRSLCVRPAYRRRGIARALLLHSFAQFRDRGLETVELEVDSENLTGALRLYERVGMQVRHRTIEYEHVLRDGRDLAVRELGA